MISNFVHAYDITIQNITSNVLFAILISKDIKKRYSCEKGNIYLQDQLTYPVPLPTPDKPLTALAEK